MTSTPGLTFRSCGPSRRAGCWWWRKAFSPARGPAPPPRWNNWPAFSTPRPGGRKNQNSTDMNNKMDEYCDLRKIPLNPPLEKGDFKEVCFYPPFLKGGKGG